MSDEHEEEKYRAIRRCFEATHPARNLSSETVERPQRDDGTADIVGDLRRYYAAREIPPWNTIQDAADQIERSRAVREQATSCVASIRTRVGQIKAGVKDQSLDRIIDATGPLEQAARDLERVIMRARPLTAGEGQK